MSIRIALAIVGPVAVVITFIVCDVWFAGAQGVYRWMDKDGNVHYSQFPPPAETKPEPPLATEPKADAPKAATPTSPTPASGPTAPAKPVLPQPFASLKPIPLETSPTDPIGRARFLLDNRRWDSDSMRDAASEVKKALDADPGNAMALTLAARLTYRAGYVSGYHYEPRALAQAMKLVDHALAADPRLPDAHVVRGYILYFQQNFPAARQAALEAEQIRPGFAWANTLLADIANREKKYDEAHVRAQAALRTATTRSQQLDALGELATVYKAREDIASADAVYSAIVRVDPDSPWARINYAGFLSAWTEDYERAVQVAQEALRLMDFPMGHHVLAEAAMRRGNQLVEQGKDWAGAGNYYGLAVKHDPDNANAHYGLAMSYLVRASQTRDKADLDKAGAELQVALKLDPKHAQARRMYDDLVRRGWKPS